MYEWVILEKEQQMYDETMDFGRLSSGHFYAPTVSEFRYPKEEEKEEEE